MQRSDFRRISDMVWEIPQDWRDDMRVPARLYASEKLLDAVLADDSHALEQLVNTATLPGLVRYALAMPDIHQGYGFPIGGVVASRTSDGIISPGGVGYDINCGVRVLATNIPYEEAEEHLPQLAEILFQKCPSGTGTGGRLDLSRDEFERMIMEGSEWAREQGYATERDVTRTEEGGRLPDAAIDTISERAMERGIGQVGSLGSGNHFLEVDRVASIVDEEAAERMGLEEGMLAVQIHTGSRGFGHQICNDYISKYQSYIDEYGYDLPDKQLICAPFGSQAGQDYYVAMCAAANFAFVNRQMLTNAVRESFEAVLGKDFPNWEVNQVYDIAHNMAKVEDHTDTDGEPVEVVVHRKGATRAFGPGFKGLPEAYQDIGQPVLVPGSMGTSSWVLTGTSGGEETFGSTCHGAGRVMSRSQAKKDIWGEDLREQLEERGIAVRARSMSGLAEEAPTAYKDVDEVVDTVTKAGIANAVAQLVPVGIIKG